MEADAIEILVWYDNDGCIEGWFWQEDDWQADEARGPYTKSAGARRAARRWWKIRRPLAKVNTREP